MTRGQGDEVMGRQGDGEIVGRGNKETGDSQFANRLPECAYRYFWDIDPARLDAGQYSRYVIERLLEYGDLPSVRWMESRFSRDEIVEVLKTSRRLSARSANFWALYFGLPVKEVRCLSKQFWSRRAVTWPY